MPQAKPGVQRKVQWNWKPRSGFKTWVLLHDTALFVCAVIYDFVGGLAVLAGSPQYADHNPRWTLLRVILFSISQIPLGAFTAYIGICIAWCLARLPIWLVVLLRKHPPIKFIEVSPDIREVYRDKNV